MFRTENLSNEELLKQVNELASNQAERQTKIDMDRQKSVKVNSVSPSDGSEPKVVRPPLKSRRGETKGFWPKLRKLNLKFQI